jgi:ATP-binding cassette subfamily F protein 3
MLTAHHISKAFGVQTVLDSVSFSVNRGERVGLVGPNGCGKTTLLRILTGQDKPDAGTVQLTPSDLHVGYLAQGVEFRPDETLAEFLARGRDDAESLTAEVERLAEALAHAPDRLDLQREYDATLTRLASASSEAGRMKETLSALELAHLPMTTPVATLSGGQKTRLALAGVLLSKPQLLLLDEPTNHLDLAMLEWLERWLNEFRGAALIVSHDRTFLDRTVTRILDLDPEAHTLREYAGNYSKYVEQKLAERGRQWQEYTDQREEIARLQSAARHLRGIARLKRGGKADTGDKFAKGFFAGRGAATVGRAKHIEERIEHLLTDERVDKPRQSWQMKLDFSRVPASGQDVLALEDVSVGYGDNVLLRDLNLLVRHGARIALIGPNGAGKTTLLRVITGTLPPLVGRVRLGANVRIGYMAQEQEGLDPALDAFTTIRGLAPFSETEVRSFLHFFLFAGDNVFVPIQSLSFGERARLSLAALVARGCNLLLLDEPINHLDIPSRARFEQALSGFEGTLLAVVHDRYFIKRFATEIWQVQGSNIKRQISSRQQTGQPLA